MNEAKYNAFLNIFSHFLIHPVLLPHLLRLNSLKISQLSNFNPLPKVQTLVYQLLAKLSSSHTAFLIADTSLLRKTGSKFEGVRKLYMLSLNLKGLDFRRFLESLVFPTLVLALHELLEFVRDVLRRCLRFSPFPDDKLVLLLLQNFIGGGSKSLIHLLPICLFRYPNPHQGYS